MLTAAMTKRFRSFAPLDFGHPKFMKYCLSKDDLQLFFYLRMSCGKTAMRKKKKKRKLIERATASKSISPVIVWTWMNLGLQTILEKIGCVYCVRNWLFRILFGKAVRKNTLNIVVMLRARHLMNCVP